MKKTLLVLALFGTAAWSQDPQSPQTPPHTGFDLTQLDRTADPCVDVYSSPPAACEPSLPADRRGSAADEMSQNNQKKLASILEDAGKPGAVHGALEKRVGDYYASGMDETAIGSKGTAPIEPYLKRVDAVKDKAGLIDAVAELNGLGIPVLFSFGSTPDPHDASRMIAEADQGGLSLADRDYYLKTDAKSVERRQKFVEYSAGLFKLLGDTPENAKANADAVLKLETELATASMDRTARRIEESRPSHFARGLRQAGTELPSRRFARPPVLQFDSLNVATPDFFRQTSSNLDAIRSIAGRTICAGGSSRAPHPC